MFHIFAFLFLLLWIQTEQRGGRDRDRSLPATHLSVWKKMKRKRKWFQRKYKNWEKDQKYKRQWQRQRKSRWCGKWNRKKNIFLCFPLKASSKFLHVSLLKLNDEKEGKIHLKPITPLSKDRGKAEAWHDCFEWTKKNSSYSWGFPKNSSYSWGFPNWNFFRFPLQLKFSHLHVLDSFIKTFSAEISLKVQ